MPADRPFARSHAGLPIPVRPWFAGPLQDGRWLSTLSARGPARSANGTAQESCEIPATGSSHVARRRVADPPQGASWRAGCHVGPSRTGRSPDGVAGSRRLLRTTRR